MKDVHRDHLQTRPGNSTGGSEMQSQSMRPSHTQKELGWGGVRVTEEPQVRNSTHECSKHTFTHGKIPLIVSRKCVSMNHISGGEMAVPTANKQKAERLCVCVYVGERTSYLCHEIFPEGLFLKHTCLQTLCFKYTHSLKTHD